MREKIAGGYTLAQFELGRRYDAGDTVSQDFHEAAKWYKRAALQGHASAELNIAKYT